ncbi:hypothetical protein IKG20_00915 [Candidatus Saccharibacteria bacterium]|nr:hypothetical protein [Candidatus Saccharibacteria bacterium]
MNEYDFNQMLNQFYSRVAEVEKLAEDAEGSTRNEVISKLTDFTEISALQDEFWRKYVYTSELDDDLTARLLELLTLEKKTSEETIDTVRDIVSLSRRTGIAATTLLGAIRRLNDRNAELIEEQKSEVLRLKEYEEAFYDMGPSFSACCGGHGDEEE